MTRKRRAGGGVVLLRGLFQHPYTLPTGPEHTLIRLQSRIGSTQRNPNQRIPSTAARNNRKLVGRNIVVIIISVFVFAFFFLLSLYSSSHHSFLPSLQNATLALRHAEKLQWLFQVQFSAVNTLIREFVDAVTENR